MSKKNKKKSNYAEQAGKRQQSSEKTKKKQQLKANSESNRKFWKIWAYPIAALLAIVVYGQTINYGLVYFDDSVIIEKVISDISGIGEISKSFNHSYANFYRPLQNVTFVIDRAISGDGYVGYHITNLLIHCLTIFSVILVLRTLKVSDRKSFFAGLVYAVHPLFAHAIIWIPSRGDLLLCLFAVMSIWSFIKYFETKKINYFIYHIILVFLAAISKETAMIIPAVSLLYLILKDVKSLKSLKIVYFIVVWLAIGVIWYLLRTSATTSMPQESSFGLAALTKNLPAALEMLGKLFLPVNLSVMATFSVFSTVSGLLVLIGIILLIYLKKETRKTVLFGIGWYFLFLLPTLVFRLQQADDFFDYLEHRAYLPAIGILIILAAYIPEKVFQTKNRVYLLISSAVVALLAALTSFRSTDYSSSLNYWQAAVRGNDGRAFFYNNLAKTYSEKNEIGKAAECFQKSINLAPQYSMPYDGLAGIYFQKQDYNKAMQLMETAISRGNATVEIYNNYGGLANTMQKYDKTIKVTKESIEKFGEAPTALSLIAKAYAGLRDPDNAMNYAEKIQNPNTKLFLKRDVFVILAQAYIGAGNFGESIAYAQKAIELQPNFGYAFAIIGTAYANQGDFANAVPNWKKAYSLDPKLVQVKKQLFLYYKDIAKVPAEAEKYRI